MISYIGDFLCKLDVKSRVLFPAAFRRQMGEDSSTQFVLRKDIYEKCIVMVPIEEWERQNALLLKHLNPYNEEHSRFIRMFYKDVHHVQLDSAGRMLLPSRLLSLVAIDKEILLAGQLGRIEIWRKDLYDAATGMAEFGRLAEKLGTLKLNDN